LLGFSKKEIEGFDIQDLEAIEQARAKLIFLNNSQEILIRKYHHALSNNASQDHINKLVQLLLEGKITNQAPKLTREEFESLDIDIEKTGIKLN
jgi:ribosomal protein S3AE